MRKILIVVTLFILFAPYFSVNAQMRQGPGMMQCPCMMQGPGMGQGSSMNQGPDMMQQQAQYNQAITEEQAKNIIQNYINQNPSYNFIVTGYAIFATPRGASSYVFELQSGNTNYMIYINPNGFTLGPSPVKKF